MKVQITKKRIAKFLLYGFTSLLVTVGIAFLVLQIPAVQKALLDRYFGKLKLQSNFEITTQKLHLYWYDRLEVSGLKVVDPVKNEMIFIDQLLINFQFNQLTANKEVNIDAVSLDSARVSLVYIPESDTSKDININEFITAINIMFAPPPGTSGKSPKVNIGEVVLTNSFFSLHHPDKDSIAMGFDHNHFTMRMDDAELLGFQVIGDTIHVRLTVKEKKEMKRLGGGNITAEIKILNQDGKTVQNPARFRHLLFVAAVHTKYNALCRLED